MTYKLNAFKFNKLLGDLIRGHIMQNILKMPDYNDLTNLSNTQLIRRIKMAKYDLDEARQRGENTTEKARIYHVFQREQLKRLKSGEAVKP
jgi:hypothetical protein